MNFAKVSRLDILNLTKDFAPNSNIRNFLASIILRNPRVIFSAVKYFLDDLKNKKSDLIEILNNLKKILGRFFVDKNKINKNELKNSVKNVTPENYKEIISDLISAGRSVGHLKDISIQQAEKLRHEFFEIFNELLSQLELFIRNYQNYPETLTRSAEYILKIHKPAALELLDKAFAELDRGNISEFKKQLALCITFLNKTFKDSQTLLSCDIIPETSHHLARVEIPVKMAQVIFDENIPVTIYRQQSENITLSIKGPQKQKLISEGLNFPYKFIEEDRVAIVSFPIQNFWSTDYLTSNTGSIQNGILHDDEKDFLELNVKIGDEVYYDSVFYRIYDVKNHDLYLAGNPPNASGPIVYQIYAENNLKISVDENIFIISLPRTFNKQTLADAVNRTGVLSFYEGVLSGFIKTVEAGKTLRVVKNNLAEKILRFNNFEDIFVKKNNVWTFRSGQETGSVEFAYGTYGSAETLSDSFNIRYSGSLKLVAIAENGKLIIEGPQRNGKIEYEGPGEFIFNQEPGSNFDADEAISHWNLPVKFDSENSKLIFEQVMKIDFSRNFLAFGIDRGVYSGKTRSLKKTSGLKIGDHIFVNGQDAAVIVGETDEYFVLDREIPCDAELKAEFKGLKEADEKCFELKNYFEKLKNLDLEQRWATWISFIGHPVVTQIIADINVVISELNSLNFDFPNYEREFLTFLEKSERHKMDLLQQAVKLMDFESVFDDNKHTSSYDEIIERLLEE